MGIRLRLRYTITILLICGFVATLSRADETRTGLSICGLQIGQRLSEIKSKFPDGRISQSRILENGQWLYVKDENAGVHLLSEMVKVVGGTSLDSGNDTIVEPGHNRRQVLDELRSRDWALDVEWTKSSDVAGYRYSVLRLKAPSNEVVLIVFLLNNGKFPSENDKVSEIYLRSSDVFGPYGDKDYP